MFVAPLAWMVLTTFKQDHELIRRPARWLPDLPSLAEASPFQDDERTHRLRLGAVIAVDRQGGEHALTCIGTATDGGSTLTPDDARWATWSRSSTRAAPAVIRDFPPA